MSSSVPLANIEVSPDVGDYCRRVEEHLARVNEGHLVRIVGTGFELVRAWALQGIPLSVVCRGIDEKAERHRKGKSRRPLRLEFCESDVRAIHDDWRRAIGLMDYGPDAPQQDPSDSDGPRDERRRPSLTRQIDRAVERLVRVEGRLELPNSLRQGFAAILSQLVALREDAAHARGPARARIADALMQLDRDMIDVARHAMHNELNGLESEVAADLASYRGRMSSDAWHQSLAAGVDRLLRDRLGLPTLDPHLS